MNAITEKVKSLPPKPNKETGALVKRMVLGAASYREKPAGQRGKFVILGLDAEDGPPLVQHVLNSGEPQFIFKSILHCIENVMAAGLNCQMKLSLVREDLPIARAGKAEDVIAVLALDLDFDSAHDPATRAERLPIVAHAEIESSPGNMHAIYFLDPPGSPEETAPVYSQLVVVSGADLGHRTIDSYVRPPGTYNVPTDQKIFAGRSQVPYLVRLLPNPMAEPASVAAIKAAILKKYPGTQFTPKPMATAEDFDWAQRERPAHSLSDEMTDALFAKEGDRSNNAAAAMMNLRLAGHSPEEIVDIIWQRQYTRVGSHYTSEDAVRTDVMRWWGKQPAAKAPSEAFAEFITSPQAVSSNEEGPEDIFERAIPSDMPDVTRDMLPAVIADFAEDVADRMQCTKAMIAIPMLVAAAACTHDAYQLQPQALDTSWTEPARLWSMVIEKPSGAKTPAADNALKIASKINSEWAAQYYEDLAKHKALLAENHELEKAFGAGMLGEAPKMRCLVINAFTVEGLRRPLADNPGGLLVEANELASIFGGLNQYKGGVGNDRQALIELWDGRPKTIHLAKGSFHIPNWGVSVFGTIQPEVLTAIVKQRAMTADGLFQRFMPFYGRTLGPGLDRLVNQAATHRYETVIRLLAEHLPKPHSPVTSTLDPQARELWESIKAFRWSSYQAPDELRADGYHGKFPKIFARLVMTMHAIECAAAAPSVTAVRIAPVVPAVTVQKAHRLLTEFFLPQGKMVYGRMFTEAEIDAQWIGDHILAHHLASVTLSALKRAHNRSDDVILKAMARLQDAGWVGEPIDQGRRYTGRAVKWEVNGAVHERFADRAEEVMSQRGALGLGIE